MNGLAAIQSFLSQLYDLGSEAPPVEGFLCGAEVVERVLGQHPGHRREVLVVAEEGGDALLGLYLDPGALAAVSTDFEARCLATEGVSHFLYVCVRASHAWPVSALELELQGEVDKYATALLGRRTSQAGLRRRSRRVRRRLFDHVRFLDPADTPTGQRYRVAHRLAWSYTARLQALVDAGRLRELRAELRRFYRMSWRAKRERARGGAWSP